MEILALASGSSGNATLVASKETSVLIDTGISALALRQRLQAFGRSVDDVSAVLLTHEHSDHVRGLEVLLKRCPMPVWATAGTWSRLAVRADGGGELLSGRLLKLGSISVLPVATSHDAREPVALIIDDGTHRVGVCTDTGIFTGLLARRLAGCETLLLETNHDSDMLRHGPYPWPLKQRIASRLGHLANHQAEEALHQVRSLWLRAVVGVHLSEHNNQPPLVAEMLRRTVGAQPAVEVVTRHEMLRLRVAADEVSAERQAVPPSRRRRAVAEG